MTNEEKQNRHAEFISASQEVFEILSITTDQNAETLNLPEL